MTTRAAAVKHIKQDEYHAFKILEIPCRNWVARVLTAYEEADDDGCIYLRENTLEGQSLSHVQAELPFRDDTTELISRMETVKVKVSQRLYYRYHQWMGSEVFNLGNFYEKIAQRLLMAWIDAGRAFGQTQKDSVLKFYEEFGIDQEEYPVLNAIQLYKKHRVC